MQNTELKTIKLNKPNKERGLPLMETLSVRASAREWSDRNLSLQDISDLLWATNGVNRPDEKKYTAPSAQNAHDVDVYVFMKDGGYRYDAENHVLEPVLAGDFRSRLMMSPPPRLPESGGSLLPPPKHASNPPIEIILVSDVSRFKFGPPELKPEWGAIDAGIVSQNISLFCAAIGLGTRPRTSIEKEVIINLLKLSDTQHVLLNHPVGYSE